MPCILHNRRSIRLNKYNYSKPGYYYVTICTYKKKHLFGTVKNDEMVLNEFGKIVQNEWNKTEQLRDNVDLDQFAIMPNHVHGIIIIRRGVLQYAPTSRFYSPSQTLGAIICGFISR